MEWSPGVFLGVPSLSPSLAVCQCLGGAANPSPSGGWGCARARAKAQGGCGSNTGAQSSWILSLHTGGQQGLAGYLYFASLKWHCRPVFVSDSCFNSVTVGQMNVYQHHGIKGTELRDTPRRHHTRMLWHQDHSWGGSTSQTCSRAHQWAFFSWKPTHPLEWQH